MNKKLAILELARHRQPALLIMGQTVSKFGDGVALVALTLLVLDTTTQRLEVGVVRRGANRRRRDLPSGRRRDRRPILTPDTAADLGLRLERC